MADISYPSTLRGAIQSAKQVAKSAGFRESSPAGGASYVERFTVNQPVFISFNLVFNLSEAAAFDVWVRANGIFDNGALFNFPIRDQYGLSQQEARFTSGGVPTYSQTGNVITYSGCQIIIPNYDQPDADFLAGYYDIYGYGNSATNAFNQIDIAVNVNYPEVF